jgi:hypothetical protein
LKITVTITITRAAIHRALIQSLFLSFGKRFFPTCRIHYL